MRKNVQAESVKFSNWENPNLPHSLRSAATTQWLNTSSPRGKHCRPPKQPLTLFPSSDPHQVANNSNQNNYKAPTNNLVPRTSDNPTNHHHQTSTLFPIPSSLNLLLRRGASSSDEPAQINKKRKRKKIFSPPSHFPFYDFFSLVFQDVRCRSHGL